MAKEKSFMVFAILSVFFHGCTASSVTDMNKETGLREIYLQALEKKSDAPWSIVNLYNPENNTIFIPYQLWTGMGWHGDKDAPCMHQANSFFSVNGASDTTITGPFEWQGESVWYREKANGSKQQYFVCNPKGIGRVYDSRYPKREFAPGRCKFPAGYGWQIGVERECIDTSITITKILFDSSFDLFALEFEWRTNGYHDHSYRYEVGYGMSDAWKQ